MDERRTMSDLSRRDLLKLGSAAAVVGAGAHVLDLARPAPADAQTPKRGGTFRLRSHVAPVHFDPQQTIAFSTMIPLSFAYSRLVKVKAGPSVVPGTQPIEGDLAESWERQGDTVYVFKLKKGVRWHNKPPVNGRELTAEDVKYTYERFLTVKGNGNKCHPRDAGQGGGARQVHRPVHPPGAERVVRGPARLHLDLDHRQGVRGEVRRPQVAGLRRGHGPLDAPAVRAERADLLRPEPELLRPRASLCGWRGDLALRRPRRRLRRVPCRRVRLRPRVRDGDPPERPRHRQGPRQGARHPRLHRRLRRLLGHEARPGPVQGRPRPPGRRHVRQLAGDAGDQCLVPGPGRAQSR